MKAEWSQPVSGNSPLWKKAVENLKVPLVDTPVVALHSGGILAKNSGKKH